MEFSPICCQETIRTRYLGETKEVAKLRGGGHLAALLLSEASLGGAEIPGGLAWEEGGWGSS